METVVDARRYTGREWDELLRAMSARDIKKTLKDAYRRLGKQVADLARGALAGSGLSNGARMKRNVRVRVYPRGGGFMVTVKPHGKSGYYTNRRGRQKPVAMWAAEGTKERETRRGGRRGAMPAYGFMAAADKGAAGIIEAGLPPEIERAAVKRLEKAGWD